jgi:hypothetical protein
MRAKLEQRWRKLRGMSRDELFARSRQELGKRTDEILSRAGYDFSRRVPVLQGPTQPAQFFFTPEQIPSILSVLSERLPQDAAQILARAQRICEHRFDLLGFENLDFGREIDWHLDPVHNKRAPNVIFHKVPYLDFEQCGDVKITWELNRHQHFVTLAKAYQLSGDEKFAAELFAQWSHWLAQNPYPVGVNWASSLEVAFRSLSWFWAYYLISGSKNKPAGFDAEYLRAQALNGRHIERYLSTYFSANTHLLGEGVALFFLGTLLPQLKSAERWRKLGWQIILAEAKNQVRADGFHFEQSTYYHVYAVDFFLHAAVLAMNNGIPLPPEFEQKLQKMLDALSLLGSNGCVPRFGDDDGGRLFDGRRNRAEHLLDPLATGAILFGRGDFKTVAQVLREETLWLLGTAGAAEFDRIEPKPIESVSGALLKAGVHVMSDPQIRTTIDAGPLGAGTGGHGHADALSLLMADGQGPLLIDSGTFEYIGAGPERNQYRATAAHNTLVVDDKDQADAKGPFAWTSLPSAKAEKWINGESFDLFVGSHDGFRCLPQPVTHRRWVFSLKSEFVLVRDIAEGEGKHRLDLYWHLAPEFRSQGRHGDAFLDARRERGVLTIPVERHGWAQDVRQGSWSPAYGKAERAAILHFGTVASLPAEFVTLLVPVIKAQVRGGELTAIPEASDARIVRGYRYVTSLRDHRMFFAPENKGWSAGDWASDAEFLYSSADKQGNNRSLIFYNGSYVSMSGRKLVECSRKVSRYESIAIDQEVKTFSSEPDAVRPDTPSSSEPPAAEPVAEGRGN